MHELEPKQSRQGAKPRIHHQLNIDVSLLFGTSLSVQPSFPAREGCALDAMDITIGFNELLRQRDAPAAKKRVTMDAIDGFLKEAYRIVRHPTPFFLATTHELTGCDRTRTSPVCIENSKTLDRPTSRLHNQERRIAELQRGNHAYSRTEIEKTSTPMRNR